MSLTSLQKATLAQLNISTWRRTEQFVWQNDASQSISTDNAVLEDSNSTIEPDNLTSDLQSADVTVNSDVGISSAEEIQSAENQAEVGTKAGIQCQLAIASDNWMLLSEQAQLDIQKLLVELEIEMTMMTEDPSCYTASIATVSMDTQHPADVKKSIWTVLSTRH